jgi:pilus assembly protein CpaE
MIACIIHPDAANPRIVTLGQFMEKLGYQIRHAASLAAAAAEPGLQTSRENIILAPMTEEWRPEPGALVALAEQVAGRAFLVHVCDEISPDDYKALLRTGAADCIDWKNAPHEIFEISTRLRSDAPAAAGASDVSKHVIVGLLPAGGGVGNTTLAVEAGVHIALQKGREVRRFAAVELDFNQAALCDYVDLTPRLDIAELARNPRRLDDYMLDIFKSHHDSGLDLFSSLEPPADCAVIDGATVFALLGKLHDRYDLLLLDFPDFHPPWSDDALRNCDFVVVTGRNSVPSIKRMARELKRLRDMGLDPTRIAAVVTHCATNFLGAMTDKGSIEAALRGHRVYCVRDDRAAALEAVNSGAPMAQLHADRGISKDIKTVAEMLRALTPRKLI